ISGSKELAVSELPWPVLIDPVSLSLMNITWGAVQDFFEAVRSTLEPEAFIALLKATRRRFHPDKWPVR
ncbi:hypothetical protein BJ138DRAFT_978471, partial [Hygrophoropsis aurantiaca]